MHTLANYSTREITLTVMIIMIYINNDHYSQQYVSDCHYNVHVGGILNNLSST